MVGQQVDFVDIEYAPVRRSQQAGLETRDPPLSACLQIQVPITRSSVAPSGKVTKGTLSACVVASPVLQVSQC